MSSQMSRTFILSALASIILFLATVTSPGRTAPLSRDVWVAVRGDGKPGRGSVSNPYNASTQTMFDSRMASFGLNTHIHLAGGTFQTAWNHTWVVKDGWWITGAGMKATTIKIVGSLRGHPGVSASALSGIYDRIVNGLVVTDLTIDCNWRELANSADTGAVVRTFTNNAAVSDSTTIISTNGAFTQLDVGRV